MANESTAYQSWIRQQPCIACGREPGGEIHHVGRKGMSQRTSDANGVPLCRQCHQDLGDLHGWARGFTKPHRKTWEEVSLLVTRGRARAAGWRWNDGSCVRVNPDDVGKVPGEVF
jgi:hypothetical protein